MQALRVDWPVYPRRAEHNTVAEGGNRRWAETARQNAFQSGTPGKGPPMSGVGLCARRRPALAVGSANTPRRLRHAQRPQRLFLYVNEALASGFPTASAG